jgi:hypothetical protein
MTAITLSFTSSSFKLKRTNKRTGGYFVMYEGKLLKECSTYETALKHYRNHQGSVIHCAASAMQFYGKMLRS